MAHNIFLDEQTGRHSFFSVKQKAWHGLGRIVQDYPTSAEAIQFAGLDYEVIKSPLHTVGNSLSITEFPDFEQARFHNYFRLYFSRSTTISLLN